MSSFKSSFECFPCSNLSVSPGVAFSRTNHATYEHKPGKQSKLQPRDSQKPDNNNTGPRGRIYRAGEAQNGLLLQYVVVTRTGAAAATGKVRKAAKSGRAFS